MVEEDPDMDDRIISELGASRRVMLSVPSFAAVWQAVATTDLLGIIPLQLAERVAQGAGLSLHPAPFKLTNAHLCQVWHRRNTANRAQAWLRQQARELLALIDDGPD